ncbi:MAG: DNA recombination protein RmuC, partial [Gammaproteobacteria bacterium]|nr:DNA recombination protein RmuC [Gammaproteobacteria bacterium]
MHIDQQTLHLILVSIGSFITGIILFWLFYRSKSSRLLSQSLQNLQLQNNSERKILELDLENFENELDILREQLADKEIALYKKIDELSKMNELKAIYATRAAQINDYKEAIEKSSLQTQELRDESYEYQKQLSETQIKSDEKLKAAHLIIENLEQSKQQLSEQFELLGNKIFSQNSQQLKQSNQQEISSLLTPFKEQFTEFKRKVEDIHEIESRDRVSLATQVKQLSSLNQKISEDTVNLTRALKGDVKFQGNWGEMILENLLESSGLRKDLEYIIQPSFRDDDKHLLRPDVVINLPDKKTVIIDSKVSLKSYSQYVASIDED